MEFRAHWSSVKTFYFKHENVILRVPFCFFLQLAMYFDKIVKESDDEDAKTSYEIAGTCVLIVPLRSRCRKYRVTCKKKKTTTLDYFRI